jgi:hypothetical protein
MFTDQSPLLESSKSTQLLEVSAPSQSSSPWITTQ